MGLLICEDVWSRRTAPRPSWPPRARAFWSASTPRRSRSGTARRARSDAARARRRDGLRRSPTSTWSAARTSWSSTAARGRRRRRATSSPRAAPSARSCSSPTSRSRQRATGDRGARRRSTPATRPTGPRHRGRHRRAARARRPRSTSALVMGTRDYLRKNGFRTAVIGLSGGIDSSLVAAIAVDAVGARAVRGFAMPSSLLLGALGQRRRGAGAAARHRARRPCPIEPAHQAFGSMLARRARRRAGGPDRREPPVAHPRRAA